MKRAACTQAPCCTLWTDRGCNVSADSQRWLNEYGGQRKILTKKRLRQLCCDTAASVLTSGQALAEQLSDPPLRPCQEACLEACAKGARVIEMACGTGKTRIIRELAAKQNGKVLVTVPSRVLLEQFSEELPDFCKVGTHHNDEIDMESQGFVAVTKSVHLLQKLEFEAVFIDEAHHPLPSGLPSCSELFQFSATQKQEVDFRYSLGDAIEQGVLCDYDLTVPVVTEGHPYVCLANLLSSQAGRFRRVLAYCNSIAAAKRFQQVLETVGLAAWHMNGETSNKERARVLCEFSNDLQGPVHVLVTVQVLGEGVNVPNADTCMFVEPRSSYVSIIQAIGRVLRPHPSKPMAHIVLPAIAILAAAERAGMRWSACGQGFGPKGGSERMAREETSGEEPRSADPELVNWANEDGLDGRHNSERILPQTPASPLPHDSGDAIVGTSGRRGRQGRKLGSCGGDNANTAELADSSSPRTIPTDGWSNAEDAGLQSHPARAESVAPASTVSEQDALVVKLESPPKELPEESTSARSCGQAQVALRQCRLLHADSPNANAPFASMRAEELVPGPSMDSKEDPRSLMCRRASKLKVETTVTTDGTGLFGSGHADQLDRFLEAIAEADSRFVETDIRHLQSRLWVVDCRLQQSNVKQLFARDVQYQLALILQQRDPWDLRLQEVEQFDQDNGKLPRQLSHHLEERTLAEWLHNQGYRVKQQTLSADRVHKLLNSFSSRLRARAAKWLEPEAYFETWIEELRQFVHLHRRMPGQSKANPGEERQLLQRLRNLVNPSNKNYKRRLQLLYEIGPVVADWVKSMRTWKVRVDEARWSRQFDRLLGFVEANERLPRRRPKQSLYGWLCRQRRQLNYLPAELRAKLLRSHPIIATFLQS